MTVAILGTAGGAAHDAGATCDAGAAGGASDAGGTGAAGGAGAAGGGRAAGAVLCAAFQARSFLRISAKKSALSPFFLYNPMKPCKKHLCSKAARCSPVNLWQIL